MMKNIKNKIMIVLFIITLTIFPLHINAVEQANETALSLTQNNEVIHSFVVSNMMPGDSIDEVFTLHITHENSIRIQCYFEAFETSSPELLSALQVEVYLPQVDKVIYEGTLDEFSFNEEYLYIESTSFNTSMVDYEIHVYLPKETGNECMNTQIYGEFIWICIENESIPDDGVILPPDTKDHSYVNEWVIVFSISAFLLLLLCIKRRKAYE